MKWTIFSLNRLMIIEPVVDICARRILHFLSDGVYLSFIRFSATAHIRMLCNVVQCWGLCVSSIKWRAGWKTNMDPTIFVISIDDPPVFR